MERISLLASDNGLQLTSTGDALSVIYSGLEGCIFVEGDLSPDFFHLENQLAGDLFQKFINYKFKVAFVLAENHNFGERVTELAREHMHHPTVRFFTVLKDAKQWFEYEN